MNDENCMKLMSSYIKYERPMFKRDPLVSLMI